MLHSTPLILGLLDPLYTFFGMLIRWLYALIPNYGLAIIFFTIFLRAIIIPLYVKNHKVQLKQMQLTDEINELKRYYANDRQGFSMAQMELFKKHKISMMGGCLPSLLGLIFIWPIWQIISCPLHYIMNVGREQIAQIAAKLQSLSLISEAEAANAFRNDAVIVQALRSNGPAFTEVVKNGWMRADQLPDLNFLGMNLGLRPSFNPAQVFGTEIATYLPLLLIPIVAVATSFIVSKVSQWTAPTFIQAKKSKELAAKNPARDVAPDQTQGMMKTMFWMMPVFTLFTVFSTPAAMGLYWIFGNVMMVVQSYTLYALYTKPVLNRIGEQEVKLSRLAERSK